MALDCVFLGGANGVGASCIALRICERWIVVDAGVRVGVPPERSLPNLTFLDDKDVAAILVTHAHADHIGALPLLRERYPTVPIYASPATIAIMRVMFADALRVMARRATEELEVPLFDDELVTATLQRMRPLPIDATRVIPAHPAVKVTAIPAGHVAGALSLALQTPEGYVVISGDISGVQQRTVQSVRLPKRREPDLLILESTYGGRTHPNRQEEERRLALAVAAHIQAGRTCLIPAFALGRAQEIILILRMAMEKNLIPRFPIWVDGLVRKVCDVYTKIPEALTDHLQHRIYNKMNPFFVSGIRPVQNDRREEVLDGPPCCIISSSGMLTGGPSAYYASYLVGRSDAAILITGYQDEESPGRHLLAVAAQKESTLTIDGVKRAVKCIVEPYALSAHADHNELSAYVRGLRPAQVALVHGDKEARAALADSLQQEGFDVRCPDNNETITVTPRPGAAPSFRPAPALSAPPEQPRAAQPARPAVELPAYDPGSEPPEQPITQFFASQIAHSILGGAAVRVGVHPQRPTTFVIRFPLPDVDGPRYAEQLAEVARRTGWTVTVHPYAQIPALLAALPADIEPVRQPSVDQEQRQVVVYCQELVDDATAEAYAEEYAAATGGWKLIVRTA